MSDLLSVLPLFAEETEAALYARMAASANEGLTVEDVDEWIDTRAPGHFFTFCQPGVRELARFYDLVGTEFVAATIPALSWGQYLDALCATYSVERLASTHATGRVTFIGDVGLTVTAGARVGTEQATPEGAQKEYEVTEDGEIEEVLGAPEELKDTTESSGGGLADGDHFYAVTTVNAEGESTLSEVLKVTLAVGGDGIVKLTWDAVVGATGYRVYHATAEGGPFDFLADVSVTNYKDTGSPAPDATIHPPEEDTTGGRVTLAVEAVEPGLGFDADAGEVTLQLSESNAASVANAMAITGGTDPETDEALLRRLEERFDGIGPGNIAAYKVHVGNFPGVGKVTVVANWEGPGTVLVIVLTATGDPVSGAVVEAVQADLDPTPGKAEGWAPPGHEVTVVTAEALAIDVSGKIEFEPGYSLDGAGGTVAMRAQLVEAIRNYIETAEPGSEVVRQKIIGRIASFTGVHDVAANLKLNGTEANVALASAPTAQVGELDEVTLTEGAV